MDRKTQSFAKEVKTAIVEVQDLKSTQRSGYDNTSLFRLESQNAYDLSFTMGNNQRWQVNLQLTYIGELGQRQPTAFGVAYPQFYIGDLDTPYTGQGNTGINILSGIESSGTTFQGFYNQMINLSGSSKTIYVKAFFITTIPEATMLYFESQI